VSTDHDVREPPPLSPGDRVAVVAPSSGLAAEYPHVYERGLRRVRSFDLEPVEFPTATADDESLRANPEARAADVERAFADPDIDGVIATIGGVDQVRVLDHLDADLLCEHPTRFFGASDDTCLATFLWRAGVGSYYGGHLLTEFGAPGDLGEYERRALERALFDDHLGGLAPPAEFTDQDLDWADPENLDRRPAFETDPGWRWSGPDRRVEGRLFGGCLTVVHLLAASGWLPPVEDLQGAVLLLETSELLPAPATVEQVLLGLGERGVLEAVDGLLLGRVKARSHRLERDADARREYREAVRGTVREVVSDYDPETVVVSGLPVGHTRPVVPLPVGGRVLLDPGDGRVAFPGDG
jgi:muramoyltetrapeptide carboxypeptidase LdcA involved in peptidoglycan recycling